jgi:hypothetical protein
LKRPSFQFYPGDWFHDASLRACSLAARGLWADMLCIMHQGTPYGHLTLPATGEDGRKDVLRPILPHILARMVGTSTEDVQRLLEELESAGVFSRSEDGIIYSRRMVKDERLRESRANGGIQSLNNPNVPRPRDDRKDTLEGSFPPSFGGSPSSSSSSSSSKNIISNPSGFDDAVKVIFDHYLERTGRNPKTYEFTAMRKRKGVARLRECLRKTGGDLAKAVDLMQIAIEGLVASDFHMGGDPKSGGKKYCDWEKHVFKSYEQMEGWWNRVSQLPARSNGHGLAEVCA